MSTLVTDAQAKAMRFDADTMWIDLEDDRQLGEPLAYFPRLLNATLAQREKVTINGGGKDLHWDDLNAAAVQSIIQHSQILVDLILNRITSEFPSLLEKA